jgi:transposase
MTELVEARGARLLFLPPYSPDFAPINQAWSNLKTALRTAGARSRDALKWALDQAVVWITSQDAQNWLDHCSYHLHAL